MTTKRLLDVCDFQGGTQPPKDEWINDSREGYVRMLQIRDYSQGDAKFIQYVKDTKKLHKCTKDDIMLSRYGYIGQAFIGLEGAYNVALVKVIKKAEIHTPYLLCYFQSYYFQHFLLSNVGARATIPGFNKDELEKALIRIPEMCEQIEIASKITKVDELIGFHKQQLNVLDTLIKSRFIELFGDVMRNSKSWKVYSIAEISSSRLGKMLDTKQQTGKCSYPYLANFNVQWFSFNLDNLNQMDFNEAEQIEFELRNGDLLVCEGGEIGRCAVWHNEIKPCFFQKALHRVRCNRQLVHPYYLAWWFKYNCDHNGFEAIAGAKATIAHLPGVKLKQLQVAVPPVEFQEQFAAFVEQVDKSKFYIVQMQILLRLLIRAIQQKTTEVLL